MPFTTTSFRRLSAEWKPQSAMQLTFPHEKTDWAGVLDEVLPSFANIAGGINRFEKVLLVCRDTAAAKKLLINAVQENLLFAECDSNDTWARDHGDITVFCPPLEEGRGEENKKPLILDFVFNGWGPKFPADKDNLITRHIYNKGVFNADIAHGGIVLEGGALQQMEAELRAFRKKDGSPYRLVSLPWPDACFDPESHRLPGRCIVLLCNTRKV